MQYIYNIQYLYSDIYVSEKIQCSIYITYNTCIVIYMLVIRYNAVYI